MAEWTFLTNHARVLIFLAKQPSIKKNTLEQAALFPNRSAAPG
jgi:hypothetical protein